MGKPIYFKILTRLAHIIFKDAVVSEHYQSSSVVAKQLVSSRGEQAALNEGICHHSSVQNATDVGWLRFLVDIQ